MARSNMSCLRCLYPMDIIVEDNEEFLVCTNEGSIEEDICGIWLKLSDYERLKEFDETNKTEEVQLKLF